LRGHPQCARADFIFAAPRARGPVSLQKSFWAMVAVLRPRLAAVATALALMLLAPRLAPSSAPSSAAATTTRATQERAAAAGANKSFVLGGPDGNHFLQDGKRFRFAAGSMHYWRNKPSEWKPKLQLMREMGLNAVLTPTNWGWHEPEEGQWDFSGDKDLVQFVRTALEVGLLVVLRLGSYAVSLHGAHLPHTELLCVQHR
jgi:hypothetical protein